MAESASTRRAVVLLATAAVVLTAMLVFPLWRPLLVAAILAGVLVPFFEGVVKRMGGRRSLAATIFTLGTVLLILVPLAALTAVAVSEAMEASVTIKQTLASEGLTGLIARAPDPIEGWLRQAQKHVPGKIEQARAEVQAGGRWALGAISGTLLAVGDFAFQLVMMLIAFFFFLRDGRALVAWLIDATPLPAPRVQELMREFRVVARSVLGANFITGAVQTVVATAGYFIARAPSPIFVGLLTLFASLIPSIGTALVTLPLASILLLLGHKWAALFLALWSLVLVGLIDNILRPYLIRGGAHLHGALVFFSLIGAISAFGAIGIFLGPMVLTFFITAVRISKKTPAPA
jgi:predicted PurR-regulated permease PerM